MVEVESIEHLAQSLCFTSAILFALIATFSRSEKAESIAQNAIAILLVLSAAVLWWLSLSGGELWGSNYLPKPLSLICLILAFSARMNIKGKNISFGANPHNINKKDESDDSEE
ncbi:hypothetical protein OAM96_01180 [Candidatus Poseidoniaceae archaeon]|nr:hypothetical protein [Candidatus Poseidoniaceae archaeon]